MIKKPGIHLMGLVVEPEKLLSDMKAMGLELEEKIADGIHNFAA